MMDPITQRSALIATCIHACLLFLAFAPRGCSTIEQQAPPPPSSEILEPIKEPPQANKQTTTATSSDTPRKSSLQSPSSPSPAYASVVAVPKTATATPSLPTLGAGDLPALPPINDMILGVNQDRAGQQQTKGRETSGTTLVDLPALPVSQDDLIARLRGQRTSNQTLSREQRMLASAQEFLHGRLQAQIQQKWGHLLSKVTEHRLIIECRVNDRGSLIHARLVNSSGSLTLDRLIDEWLIGGKLSLPPITPNITYPFLIVIQK